jgi:pimeloyl-ACP methyl ester carboxylesterase
MATYTHHTAPTQFIEANGIRFAYRRFGKPGAVPLVFNMHFTGTMDHWDPAVTDGFARDREVILFNNAGVSSSSGEVPDTISEMGANAIAFIRALGFKHGDVLGFSIGGLVAQEIALQAPDLVRSLVLVGTGPRSGESMDTGTPEGKEIFGATYAKPDDLWLRVHFTPSEASQRAGAAFLERSSWRIDNRDPDAGRQRQRRRHHLHGQFLHPPATSAEREADPLSGLSTWVALSVSRDVRPRCRRLSRPKAMELSAARPSRQCECHGIIANVANP